MVTELTGGIRVDMVVTELTGGNRVDRWYQS